MTGYAALLRAVNVGGRGKLPMADLRALLTDLGFGAVRTLLQSGNAVLTSDDDASTVEARIEAALADRLGLRTRCLVRSATDLRAVIDAHPLADAATDGSRMMAVFLSDRPDPGAVAEHDVTALDPGSIVVGDRVVYQWCPDGIMAAPSLVPYLEKRWGVAATARNWNTVGKLAAAV